MLTLIVILAVICNSIQYSLIRPSAPYHQLQLNGNLLQSKAIDHERTKLLKSSFIYSSQSKKDGNPSYKFSSSGNRWSRSIALFASAEDKEPMDSDSSKSTTTSTKSTSNIDLFAVGPKRAPTTSKKVDIIEPVPSPTVSTPTTSLSSSASSLSPSAGSRGNLMELQAEKLRLEAEKEQVVVDQARVEKDIVSTYSISFD